jgi:hypothetical protein
MVNGSWQALIGSALVARKRLIPIAVATAVACSGCGSGGAAGISSEATTHTPAASGGPTTPASRSATTAPRTAAIGPQLLVLADGISGGMGLWTFGGAWSQTAPAAGATAIARDGEKLVLAIGGSIETRSMAAPAVTGPRLSPDWGAKPLAGSIVAIDCDSGGTIAVVANDSGNLTFALVTGDGKTNGLSPAPQSPFGPSLAWLNAGRLAVLSSDAMQVPRLAVIDTASHSVTLLNGLAGVRTFALSPDRQTLAAATESAVFVAPVKDWLADKAPAKAVALASSRVVWDLALSADGSKLALLSGAVDPAGAVSDTHDIGYVRNGDAWSMAFDSVVPFTRAAGQVWLQ